MPALERCAMIHAVSEDAAVGRE